MNENETKNKSLIDLYEEMEKQKNPKKQKILEMKEDILTLYKQGVSIQTITKLLKKMHISVTAETLKKYIPELQKKEKPKVEEHQEHYEKKVTFGS